MTQQDFATQLEQMVSTSWNYCLAKAMAYCLEYRVELTRYSYSFDVEEVYASKVRTTNNYYFTNSCCLEQNDVDYLVKRITISDSCSSDLLGCTDFNSNILVWSFVSNCLLEDLGCSNNLGNCYSNALVCLYRVMASFRTYFDISLIFRKLNSIFDLNQVVWFDTFNVIRPIF